MFVSPSVDTQSPAPEEGSQKRLSDVPSRPPDRTSLNDTRFESLKKGIYSADISPLSSSSREGLSRASQCETEAYQGERSPTQSPSQLRLFCMWLSPLALRPLGFSKLHDHLVTLPKLLLEINHCLISVHQLLLKISYFLIFENQFLLEILHHLIFLLKLI